MQDFPRSDPIQHRRQAEPSQDSLIKGPSHGQKDDNGKENQQQIE